MAYTVGTPSSNSQSGSASSIATSTTISVSAGDAIVVFSTAAQDQTTSFAASDGTNTYTRRNALYEATLDYSIGVMVAENCSAGTYTVTASWGGTRHNNSVFALPISGLKSAPYQTAGSAYQATPGTGSDGITTGNLTPTEQPACLIGMAIILETVATPALGTGFTTAATGLQFGTGTDLARVSHSRLTSTSAVPFTATATVNTYHFSIAVILGESAAGGSGLTVNAMTSLMSPLLRM